MIEILNGLHETVVYDAFHGMRLHHNIQADNYPLHWHTALEIIMPLKNDYTVIIDKIPHVLHEGDIWITPPGTLHEIIAPPTGERLILLYEYSLICNIAGMDSLLHSLHPFTLIRQDEHFELNQLLRSYLEQISDEYECKAPFMEASLYSLMMQFFVAFGRGAFDTNEHFPSISSSKQHEYIEKFTMVCNYINEHCTENINIDELAALAGFSKFHFSRLFKQFSNMSCYEYLTRQRIAYAEQLLLQPDIPITEVAMRSGFGSLSTFNRTFKSAKNCTPSEYKSLNRQTSGHIRQ